MRTTHLLLLSLLVASPAFAIGSADMMVPLDHPKAAAKPDLRLVAPQSEAQPDVVAALRCPACDATVVMGVVVAALAYASSFALVVHGAKTLPDGPWAFPTLEAATIGVPIFGPIFGGLEVFSNDRGAAALSLIDAGVQLAGVGLAIYGLHLQSEWMKQHQLVIAPMVQPGVGGMQIGGAF